MYIRIPSPGWSIFWILVHSISVFITGLLFSTISSELLFIFCSGIGIAIIAKIVRSFTRPGSIRIDTGLLFWMGATILSFWFCHLLLIETAFSEGIWYYLLMGTGIFFLLWIIQKISRTVPKKYFIKGKGYQKKIHQKKISTYQSSPTFGSHDSYLVEIRIIDRHLKAKIKDLEDVVVQKFALTDKRFVPHISLAGGMSTSSEKRLVKVFSDLCSRTPVMKFRILGFSAFEEPKRVVYFDIQPCENLKQFRYALAQQLKSFCKLKPFDFHGKDEFVFHSTLALDVPEQKFQKIRDYVRHQHYDSAEYSISRITLIKNSRILYEYDFFQKRLLTREEAKDPVQYRRTEELAKHESGFSVPVHVGTIEMNAPFYLISDTHFDHNNIIRYCNRPFKTLEQMNKTLIANWNSTIHSQDTVFFLGDMTWGRKHRPISYWLPRLNGNLQFIIGPSHDEEEIQTYFDSVIITYRGRTFLLVHNPHDRDRIPKDWSGWIIHGHKHNNSMGRYPFINGETKTINVSVELIGYKPVNIDQILAFDLDTIRRVSTIDSKPERK